MDTSVICARGVSLRDLLPNAAFLGADDIHVESCSSDSRCVEPGDLFVALTGARCDGHDFSHEAIARGAQAVLAERSLPVRGLPICLVPDTRAAYGHLCQRLAGDPSRDVKVIGVTGTNGKTTTTNLVAAMLTAAGARVGILGTLGYWDGDELAPATHTTPPAPVLAHWLERMVAVGCSHAVMEVSSHALCQDRVAGVEFDTVCATNINSDHLDYHGSLANYRNAKVRLLDHLAPTGLVVLSADDPVCSSWLSRIDGPALTVSMHRQAELTATVVERHRSEQTFLLSAGSETVPVRTRMIGDHHVTNCLIAAAIGLAHGIDLPTVVRGLESVAQVPGRMERIECGQPFTAVVDYAHAPDALAAGLTALRQVTDGRLICVFGAGGERDRGKRPVMGSVVDKLADETVITNDNPRREDPQRIADDIWRGVTRRCHARAILDRNQAIGWALAEARPGDSVLIAGKGHEPYQIIGKRRYEFDDRQVVRQILYSMAKSLPTTEVRA